MTVPDTEPPLVELQRLLVQHAADGCLPADATPSTFVFAPRQPPDVPRLPIDSLRAYGLAIELEDRYGVELDDLIAAMESEAGFTVGQLHDLVVASRRRGSPS